MVKFLVGHRKISEVLKRRTGDVWEIVTQRQTNYAYEYAYRVPTGFSIVDVQKHGDALRAALGLELELLDYAGVVVIRCIVKDLPERIYLEDCPKMEHLSICLGVDRAGEKVFASPLNPHLLIAGCSGSGKTDASRYYLYQVLKTYENCTLTLCDLKGSSYLPFEKIPGVAFAWEVKALVSLLQKAHKEMKRRVRVIREFGKRELPFPWHVILIDEIAELWARPGLKKEDRKQIQEAGSLLSSLVRLGRELKIAVWLSTQYPTREILHNQIQSNLVNRVCLKMDNPLEYEVVLGHPLSHAIPPIPGRAFVKGKGLVQIPYGGSDEEWEERIKSLERKSQDDTERTEENEYTDRIDEHSVDGYPATLPLLQWQFPTEKSIRTPERIGKGEMGRRS